VSETPEALRLYHSTRLGEIWLGDSLVTLERRVDPGSVDLIVTSPPFGLVRKKEYGNADAHEYLAWFSPFARQFRRVIKNTGSLVIDIGGAWIPGQPTRSLYHYKLLVMLCEEFGFHLAQDFFWWNPSKLPTPAEWVNIRRVRVKDAVDCVWWLSKTPWPKASNRRVLVPYSESMLELLRNGYQAKLRPSGHDISTKFSRDNGAAIPPNLIAIANTESNSHYLRFCREHGLRPNPARFPADLPEYFVRMLTDKGDLVVDPFAGSCVTGEVAERLGRRWLCGEVVEEYLRGAIARFGQRAVTKQPQRTTADYHRLYPPSVLWNGNPEEKLDLGGGRSRGTRKPRQVNYPLAIATSDSHGPFAPSPTPVAHDRARRRARPRSSAARSHKS